MWGGTGVKSAYPYHLEEYPYRLEAGTSNILGIAGLSAGHEWISKRGVENIYRHEMELMSLLEDGLREIRGVKVYAAPNKSLRVPTLSATVNGFDPSDVGTMLDVDYNVLTRTGLQCAPLIHEHIGTAPHGTIRFSIGPFNTKEHVETAIRAMGEIAAQRN